MAFTRLAMAITSPWCLVRTCAFLSRIDSLENEFAVDCFIRVRASIAVRRLKNNFEVGWRSMQRTLILISQEIPSVSRVHVWLLTDYTILKFRFYPNPADRCAMVLQGENDVQSIGDIIRNALAISAKNVPG